MVNMLLAVVFWKRWATGVVALAFCSVARRWWEVFGRWLEVVGRWWKTVVGMWLVGGVFLLRLIVTSLNWR
ncbi:hypothetical protein HanRHA438_Chr06g0283411 [Helianthus annuus]|nr:hypothetical protein HanIR_Chr06g0294961 [Helianthus annuus]KAJ0913244.1 hypothetical protein HanRHA438_Chr06g0283411 [Helianthus annuus]